MAWRKFLVSIRPFFPVAIVTHPKGRKTFAYSSTDMWCSCACASLLSFSTEPWKHALWIAGGIYVASNKDKWTEQMRARVNVIREEKGYPKYVIAEKPPKDA